MQTYRQIVRPERKHLLSHVGLNEAHAQFAHSARAPRCIRCRGAGALGLGRAPTFHARRARPPSARDARCRRPRRRYAVRLPRAARALRATRRAACSRTSVPSKSVSSISHLQLRTPPKVAEFEVTRGRLLEESRIRSAGLEAIVVPLATNATSPRDLGSGFRISASCKSRRRHDPRRYR
jgi:hypothetical protein